MKRWGWAATWLPGQGADGAKGATGEYRDLPEPSLPEEPSPRPQRGAHDVFGEQKEGSAGAQYSGVGGGRKGQTGLGHMSLQLGEATFCLWWEPPGSFLAGKPREMMWLLFARGDRGGRKRSGRSVRGHWHGVGDRGGRPGQGGGEKWADLGAFRS